MDIFKRTNLIKQCRLAYARQAKKSYAKEEYKEIQAQADLMILEALQVFDFDKLDSLQNFDKLFLAFFKQRAVFHFLNLRRGLAIGATNSEAYVQKEMLKVGATEVSSADKLSSSYQFLSLDAPSEHKAKVMELIHQLDELTNFKIFFVLRKSDDIWLALEEAAEACIKDNEDKVCEAIELIKKIKYQSELY